MILADKRFSGAVEALVTELELATDAEVVVVAAPRSGSYRDLAWAASAGAAFLALLFILWSPFHFGSWLIPLDLLLVGGLGGWVVHRTPALLRPLASAARRERQVEVAARDAFIEEAVWGTRRRTGLLVYLSDLEQRVYLLSDPALDGRIPRAAWSGLDLHPRDLDAFLSLLRAVGRILSEHVPALSDDNPDEMPNAPRVRP